MRLADNHGASLPGVPVRAGGAEGLPALLNCGVPLADGCESLSLTRLRVLSLISPPDPAASPSLPEPALERGRLLPTAGADELGGARFGDIGLDGGCAGWDCGSPFFLCFLREDSFPLASDIFGDPGRLSEEDGLVEGKGFLLGRPEGVLVPREEAPEETLGVFAFSRSDALAALASSFFRSSALASSASVSSDSLCITDVSKEFKND